MVVILLMIFIGFVSYPLRVRVSSVVMLTVIQIDFGGCLLVDCVVWSRTLEALPGLGKGNIPALL